MDPILRTSNLMKVYRQGEGYVYAVNRVTLGFAFAKLTAIVGPSGSGKSTLLHMLGGLDVPSGGDVWVKLEDGEALDSRGTEMREKNLYAMTQPELTAFRGTHFGFVFQDYQLLPVLTAEENILIPCVYGGAYFDKDWYAHLVDVLGLSDRLHHLPSELSGGECQRVAMARALIHRPRVLLADEPTGNLDTDRAAELMELLLYMRDHHNQTVVMVTHDLSLANRADQVYQIRDGAVV